MRSLRFYTWLGSVPTFMFNDLPPTLAPSPPLFSFPSFLPSFASPDPASQPPFSAHVLVRVPIRKCSIRVAYTCILDAHTPSLRPSPPLFHPFSFTRSLSTSPCCAACHSALSFPTLFHSTGSPPPCVRSLHHIAGLEALEEGGIDFQTGSAVGGSLPKYRGCIPPLFLPLLSLSFLPSVYSFDIFSRVCVYVYIFFR